MYLGTICSTYMFRQNGLDELTYFPNRNNNLKTNRLQSEYSSIRNV